MTVKASVGAALILTAGLLVGLAAPLSAKTAGEDGATASKSERATSGKIVRQGQRYLKKRYSTRKSSRVAARPAATGKPAEKAVAGASPQAIPEAVANANARMMPGDGAPDSAQAMSEAMTAKAGTILLASAEKPDEAQAERGGVVSDQLNDVDRTLQETSSKQTVAMAPVRAVQAAAPVLAASNDSGGWDRTSLIGKIFIALGALLTMASAARMFMA
ncbi:MAG: hypothetical protein PS018_14005 [bacterium]|nr:hypothetical protein [bacterium]